MKKFQKTLDTQMKFIFLFFVFLFLFGKISSVFAEDISLVSFTAPENNTYTPGTTDVLTFSIVLKFPVVVGTPQPPNDSDVIVFEGYTDISKKYQATILNQKKVNNSGKNLKIGPWEDRSVYPFDSLIYYFKVYDYNTKKVYVSGQILFKENSNYAGFYYIYKTQSQVTPTEYYFTRSNKFTDQTSCDNDWKSFLAKNPKATLYSACKKYDYLPPVPQNTVVGVDSQADDTTMKNYTLLAPIMGLTEIEVSDIGKYFNTMFNIAIGLCAALAVIMMILGAIQYMGEESIFGKTEGKHKITTALFGLIIALGSYALLNTINPDLLGGNGLNVDQVSAEIQAIENISSQSFTEITGVKKLSASEYDQLGRKVAKQVGIPFCAIRVILERESKGNPGAIGFDENVTNNGIPSRVAFINSGKKYNGQSFTPSTNLITTKGFVNQGKNDVKNTPGLGLDWRFSKGLGLTQVTLFPAGYFSSGYKTNPPNITTKDNYPTLYGMTPKDLLDPEKNLTVGAKIWKDSWIKCNKDIYGAWVGYGGGPGNCSTKNTFLIKEATMRTEFYNGCPSADKQI